MMDPQRNIFKESTDGPTILGDCARREEQIIQVGSNLRGQCCMVKC